MKIKLLTVILIIGVFLGASAHFISIVWPEKSIEANEYGNPKSPARILIGGTYSPFKEAVLKSVIDSLKPDSIYIKTVGINDLKKEKPDKWNAVLILNTCMAWEIENAVEKCINTYPKYHSFIVLTTSGDPDSCGSSKNLPTNIDAVSSASVKDKQPIVIARILSLIRQKLKK